MSPRQDGALRREMLPRRYGAGETLIYDDTPALVVFAIANGQVKLTLTTRDGHEVVVGFRGPGDLLGVREALTGQPYRASVESVRASVLCAIPRHVFLETLDNCPGFALRLLKQLAGEDLRAEEHLVERTHAPVIARTARTLVELAEGGGRDGRGSTPAVVLQAREEMAQRVGTTRETLSRVLHRLASQGAVQLENGAIRILNVGLLERYTHR